MPRGPSLRELSSTRRTPSIIPDGLTQSAEDDWRNREAWGSVSRRGRTLPYSRLVPIPHAQNSLLPGAEGEAGGH
eukprot:11227004-Lingulodinium_polyedra.AAC.1